MLHRFRTIALLVPLLLAVIYFGGGLALYSQVTRVAGSCGPHAANRPDSITFANHWPAMDFSGYLMPEYETVRLASRERGITVAGWYVAGQPGDAAVILTHGLDGCKSSVDVLVPAGMLWRNGFSVLMIDVRDVGDSSVEDGFSAAGNEEYLDVLGAWDWLMAKKGYTPERIGLYGASLGGATALYAFSHEPRVAALFLQGAFANVLTAYIENLRSYGLPGFLGYATVEMGRAVSSEDLLEHTPTEEISKAGARPVYMVHSRADRRISFRQAEELANAARAAGVNLTTWFPPAGEHLQTPAVYPEEFEQRIVGFFRDALGE